MKPKRYSKPQIIGFLKKAETGVLVKELSRQNG